MYFIDEFHEKNYNHLTNMVFRANSNPEYKTISYILGVPSIYKRCINDPMIHEFPFLWRFDYIDKTYIDTDNDGEYKVLDFDVVKDDKGNPRMSKEYETLSSAYRMLVELALNLYNSSHDKFNLMNSIDSWDDELIKVFFQAIEIRLKGGKNIEGLTLLIK